MDEPQSARPIFRFLRDLESEAQPLLNIAVRAARSAGALIVRQLERVNSLNVTTKGRNDFDTEVDRRAEQIIIDTVHKAYPNHGDLAEESGDIFAGNSRTAVKMLASAAPCLRCVRKSRAWHGQTSDGVEGWIELIYLR